MRVETILQEIRALQARVTENRNSAISARNPRAAESFRIELLELFNLEEQLLKVLDDAYTRLGVKSDDVTLAGKNTVPVKNGKRALLPGTQLATTYKGQAIQASVNQNGKILFGGKPFNSIAALAHEVTGKEKNHLRNRKFWTITLPGTV